MGMYAFQTLAYEAGAVYHIPMLPPLVNCEKFEEYLEKYNREGALKREYRITLRHGLGGCAFFDIDCQWQEHFTLMDLLTGKSCRYAYKNVNHKHICKTERGQITMDIREC